MKLVMEKQGFVLTMGYYKFYNNSVQQIKVLIYATKVFEMVFLLCNTKMFRQLCEDGTNGRTFNIKKPRACYFDIKIIVVPLISL